MNTDTDSQAPVPSRWWGAHPVPVGSSARWQIGPLDLQVSHAEREWRVAWTNSRDYRSRVLKVQVPETDAAEPPGTAQRFAVSSDEPALVLSLHLADRAIAVRTEQPLSIPVGETATLYVTSPLWLELGVVRAGAKAPTQLMKLPTYQPSDTWFGADTMTGELCYASRTWALLDAEALGYWPYRAVTPVQVTNHGEDPLTISVIKLPLENLALYVNVGQQLWTDAVVMTRRARRDVVDLQVSRESVDAGRLTRLADAREPLDGNKVFRALERLFG